jgi:arylsulfatase A-like enzyme
MRSLAAWSGQTLGAGEAPDSVDLMAVLLGNSSTGREDLVEQASGLALRVGRWKYIEPSNRPKVNANTNTELGNDTVPQLYDLGTDPGERRNLAPEQPDRVKAMAERLASIRK